MYEELVGDLLYCSKGDCNGCRRYTKDTRFCNTLLRDAADAIEELSKPRWIPVEERLPEEKRDGFSEDVLILVENPDGDITWRDIYVGYYLHDSTDSETGWWTMMTCDCAKIGEHKHGGEVFPANEYATHWMPLPQAPESPKEE